MLSGRTDVTVPLERLGALGDELGRGGQASVYALPGFTLADAPGELVFKQYHVPPTSDMDLRAIVSLRGTLDPARRQRLDELTTWPCRIVTSASVTVGVIMPRISASYVDTLALPSGKVKQSLREVLNLFAPVERIRGVGRPVPGDRQRLELVRDFAAALAFLHDELGIVFGDINARNELWRLDERPMVMFLDCDAVRPRGSVTATKQLNAPDWEPPERGTLSRATDLYKLGLFVLRSLTPGTQASTRRDPRAASGVLDATGLDMLVRALGDVPAARPGARDWTVYFSRLLGDPVDPPTLGIVELDRTLVPAGHPVEIKWTATDAAWIEVVRPGDVLRVDGRPGSGVISVRMEQTGVLTVRAGNDHGVVDRKAGLVTVIPMPTWRPIDVAVPRLSLDAVDVAQPPRLGLPPLPVVDHGVASPDPISLVTSASGAPRHAPADRPPLLSARFPLDLTGMLTAAPGFELDLTTRFEEWA